MTAISAVFGIPPFRAGKHMGSSEGEIRGIFGPHDLSEDFTFCARAADIGMLVDSSCPK